MVYAMCLENINEDNEEWLRSDVCELVFQHMMYMGIVHAATKQKGKEEDRENESEEEA
jgi:hypothetical protein